MKEPRYLETPILFDEFISFIQVELLCNISFIEMHYNVHCGALYGALVF